MPLVRWETFEALGGNTEDYGVGKDDQEFFARVVLRGYKLRHLPEALFWSRQPLVRLRQRHYSLYPGHFRIAQAYEVLPPATLQVLLLMAQGQQLELGAWNPGGEGRIGGRAARTLARARSELLGSFGSISYRGRQQRTLEKIARRAFDLQTTGFS